ncbi:MAG: glycosyltransferase family 2 protein [Deltaproteobacteria bacterium]|nr:glycosyltransferase family 2 protein [Deltaproteobacteria bacterium]
MDISIVIPLLNEEENVEEAYRQVKLVLSGMGRPYEMVFVDDGSRDKTLSILKGIASRDVSVRVISFRKNFGQTAAMSAGFDYARGKIVIPMDGDLQNDPKDIPRLIAKVEEGYDVVSGWRKERKDTFLTRRLPSMTANWLISKITGVYLHDYGCTMKAYRKEVVQNLNLYGEMHRFLPALASIYGVTVAEVVVQHHPRLRGKSKYGLSRILKVFLDLMTVKFLLSYSTKPIRLFGPLGLGALALSLLSGAAALYMKFFDELSLNRNPLFLLSVILLFMGIQLISLGLIAEMNVRTYHESQNKPIYVVKEVLGT